MNTEKLFTTHKSSRTRIFAAFTLVEVLVVMAILVILAAVSIVGMVNYAEHQRYAAVIDMIRNDLSMARQKTMASYENVVYGVYVGTTTMEFFAGNTPTVGSSDNIIINYAESGIIATSSFSNGLWYTTFAQRTGEASGAGEIVITDSTSNASTTFTISSSGLVQ